MWTLGHFDLKNIYNEGSNIVYATIEERALQQEPKKTVHLYGGHRGGTSHAGLLIPKLDAWDEPASVAFEVFDPDSIHAEAVAGMFRRGGFAAQAYAKAGPATSNATVRTWAIDNGQDVAGGMNSVMTNDMITAGIMVSVPLFENLGGFTLGLGANVTRSAIDIQSKIGAPFTQLGRMAPGRPSSRNTTQRILHTRAMMKGTRNQTHDRLSTSVANFLQHGDVESELFAVDGSTGNEYRLDVIEAQRNASRMGLVNMATQEIIPSMQLDPRDDGGGVVFLDPDDEAGWLYLVLGQNRGASWIVDHCIELPVPAMPPVTLPAMPQPITQRPKPTRRSEPTFLDVFLTD